MSLRFAQDRFDSGSCSEHDQAPRVRITRELADSDSVSIHTVSSEPTSRRSDFIPTSPMRCKSQEGLDERRRPTKRAVASGANRRRLTWGQNTEIAPCVSRDPQNSMLLLSWGEVPTRQIVSCVCCSADLIVDISVTRYNSTLQSLLVQCPHCTAVTRMPVNTCRVARRNPGIQQKHQARQRLAFLSSKST
jgi:hypothetical protein